METALTVNGVPARWYHGGSHRGVNAYPIRSPARELISDDEVALVFDPETGLSLSEPLVNIRFTLREAEEQGIISALDHAALLTAARAVFYPQRTYGRIVSLTGDAVTPETRERFLSWVKLHAVDQKRKDAVAALEYIKGLTNQV
jgi:hypothetical protein